MRHYATAPRARELPVLLESMLKHCRPFTLHVLAWDWEPECRVERGPQWEDKDDWEVEYTPRAEFLAAHPDHAPDRLPGPPRRTVDQVCGNRWRFFADVMASTGEPLTCVDGDMWFWSSPEPMFAEIGAAGMAVSPHRIPPAAAGLPGVTFETHRKYGLYNGGLCHFADPAPVLEMAALNREWSHTIDPRPRPDGTWDFGDQGHLERTAVAAGAHVIQHPGVNVAPWNLAQYDLTPAPDGGVLVDGQPLILFHYSSLRLNPDGTVAKLADPSYEVERATGVRELVYEPYIRACAEAAR